jgi:hypothetical protein
MYNWVKQGGTLIVDGQFALFNQYGLLSDHNKKLANEIFGAKMLDFKTANDSDTTVERLTGIDDGDQIPVLKLMIAFEETQAISYRFNNGDPGVTQNNFGKGRGLRIGTLFFINCFTDSLDCPRALKKILPEPLGDFLLQKGSSEFRMRVLYGNPPVLTLINYAEENLARIRVREKTKIKDLKTGETYVSSNGIILVPIAERCVRIFTSGRAARRRCRISR